MTERDVQRNLGLWLMIGILLLAAMLAWHELGVHEVLGRDENATITKLDQPGLLDVLRVTQIKVTGQPGNMQPLYFLLQHAAWSWVGRSAFMLRFLPAAFGLLGVALTFKLGQALWNREVGLVGALLTALLPLHVRYSQIARPYTLLVVFSLASAYFLLNGLRTNRARHWLGFVLTAALAFQSHYNALMVLAAEALFAALTWLAIVLAVIKDRRSPRCLIWPVLSLLLFGLLCAPSLIRLAGLSGTEPGRIAVELTFLSLNSFMYTIGMVSTWYRYLVLGLMFIGLATGLYTRRWRSVLFSLLWLGVPVMILATIPSPRPFEERYLIFLPPVALLLTGQGVSGLACGLGRLGRRWSAPGLRWVAMVALLAGLVLGLASPLRQRYALNRAADRILQTIKIVERHAGPGDLIIISPRFFVQPLAIDGAEVLYLTEHPTPSTLDELVASHVRTWVLYSSYLPPPELQEPIDRWLQAQPDQFARVPIKSISAVAYYNEALSDPQDILEDRIAVLQALAGSSQDEQEAWLRHAALAGAYQSLADLHEERGEPALAEEYRRKAEHTREAAPQP